MPTCLVCYDYYPPSHAHQCPAKRAQEPTPRSRPPTRTQKARGVVALSADHRWNVPGYLVLSEPPPHGYGWDLATTGLPMFARPCPVRPRHGFVDSRRVENRAELESLWTEARAADPHAELVVMKQIDAVASAVLAPGLLVLGPGNDGATGGHGSLSVPIRNDVVYNHATLQRAGITLAPYLEVVVGPHAKPYAVQLRDGPPCERGNDYVPERMTVEHVVNIPEKIDERPTLLEWETAVQAFAPGTAVYHPGGSRASHHFVHCREEWRLKQRCVPVLFSRPPVVGETLQVTKASPAFNPKLVMKGLALGLAHPMPPQRAVHIALFALPNSDGLSYAPLGSLVLGAGIAFALRLGMIAGYGEARHAHAQGKDVPVESRDALYLEGWQDATRMKRSLPKILALFDNHGLWHGSYGGPAWAHCMRATLDLINRVVIFTRMPTTDLLASVIQQYNQVLNMAHNGGWWFDKFSVSKSNMDAHAQGDAHAIFTTIPALWELLSTSAPDDTDLKRWHLLKEVSQPTPKPAHVCPTPEAIAAKLPKAPWTVPVLKGVTLTSAQCCMNGPVLHVQYKLSSHGEKDYSKVDLRPPSDVALWVVAHVNDQTPSYAESGKAYAALACSPTCALIPHSALPDAKKDFVVLKTKTVKNVLLPKQPKESEDDDEPEQE